MRRSGGEGSPFARKPWMGPRRGLLLLVVAASAACGGDGGSDSTREAGDPGNGAAEPGAAGSGGGPVVGQPAPAYDAVTLDGDTVSLEALRGEAVLLNVWATWCAPCRKEIPELLALHEAHDGQGLRVVGVTVDSRHAEADIRSFIQDFGITYPIWWDPDQAIVSRLGAAGVPLTILVDREGRIAWRHLGPFQRGDSELQAAMARLLGG